VCDEVHDFLKDLTTNILQIVINDNRKDSEAVILESLMKLFYNLNYQDLHPKYEENLEHWMNVLKAVMKLPNSNENIFKGKGAALEAILLYANKYKEDV
jgi:exportin-2 (importin alpha re-exporter)